MSNYYAGRVHTILFEDASEAFYILKVALEDDNPIAGMASTADVVTIRGYIPGLKIEVNSWIGFEAKWTTHEKFGRQLHVTRAPVLPNGWDADTAERMLSANGVPASVCSSIRSHVGDDKFLETLASEVLLGQVPNLGEISAALVATRWAATRTFFQTLGFLGDLGLPPGKIRQIWQTFESDAEKILSTNPWELVRIEGITFANADEIAQRLGLSLDDPNRMRGAVLYGSQTMGTFGHTYMTTGTLWVQTGTLIAGTIDKGAFAKALGSLHNDGLLVIDRTTRPGCTAIYDPFSHTMEKMSAELLLKRKDSASIAQNAADFIQALSGFGPETLLASHTQDLEHTVKTAVTEWGLQSNVDLSPMQKLGVENALTHSVSVLSGLPGTGKTTSLKAAVSILQDAEVRFLLCAPTGIAAKRLSALTGAPAFTIHRAFGAQGKSENDRTATYAGIVGESKKGGSGSAGDSSDWTYNSSNPHPAQVVIVDEASMLDQHLLYRLLSCTSETCRIVFVGDYAQLPSVGPGNVLRQLIESQLFPVVKLTTIFRQEDTSDIIFAAHDIHKGVVPNAGTTGDFVLLPISDEEKVLDTVCKLAKKLFDKNKNATSNDAKVDFQILSPRHSGMVGVTKLNERLREMLNPRSPGRNEVRVGNDTMREDDRVMISHNDYNLKVFNGDVGKITNVDRQGKTIEVKIFGDPPLIVSIDFAKARKIVRLAYACTVHKAQGLEYDIIIMPVVESFHHQLQRNLLYTAVTRAKVKVILVGTHKALERAVANAKEDARNTLFLDRLHATGAAKPA